MKIKIIDLLNKIANREETPKKIKYKNKIYEWKEYDVCYGKIMTKKGWEKEYGYVAEENRTYFYLKHCYQGLNDEVEIIEEDKKIPKKLEDFNLTTYSRDDEDLGLELHYTGVSNTFNDVYFKINEIIDYLKSKGE